MKRFPAKYRLFALGCALAILYGLAAYASFLSHKQLGSLSYLALVPIGMASIALLFDIRHSSICTERGSSHRGSLSDRSEPHGIAAQLYVLYSLRRQCVRASDCSSDSGRF